MIGGATAERIYLEVTRGISKSPKDSPKEADYRRQVVESIEKISKEGGIAEPPKELP